MKIYLFRVAASILSGKSETSSGMKWELGAPTSLYGIKTTPLNGLGTHAKGGFYHDGRFLTLLWMW